LERDDSTGHYIKQVTVTIIMKVHAAVSIQISKTKIQYFIYTTISNVFTYPKEVSA